MIMNNENKKLSQNRKRRSDQKTKMKSSLHKIKTEKKKKNKIFNEIKDLEIELVKIKNFYNPIY